MIEDDGPGAYLERCPVCRRMVLKGRHGQSECARLAGTNEPNPTGDTGNVQCRICGWWVQRGKHTWVECSSLIRVSGKLHLFDGQRQEVPQAFYDAFKNEERDNE